MEQGDTPDVQIEEVMKSERVQAFLDKLEEREKRIVMMRFGLGEYEAHTLEEVDKIRILKSIRDSSGILCLPLVNDIHRMFMMIMAGKGLVAR